MMAKSLLTHLTEEDAREMVWCVRFNCAQCTDPQEDDDCCEGCRIGEMKKRLDAIKAMPEEEQP